MKNRGGCRGKGTEGLFDEERLAACVCGHFRHVDRIEFAAFKIILWEEPALLRRWTNWNISSFRQEVAART